ncbi:MAG: glycosyltransferase family 2 protein [Paludibacteraceae bacterium]|nr:glycosyltransferase family 2 protein [Paludibacteraceae bacterium]
MELVSIIMPTYNCEQFIRESIDSVLAQTYTAWELLIVDDCSTDNTAAVMVSYTDPRIRYMRNDRNMGAALTRNRALREAKGRYIAFLDSDDLWTPDKLEKQVAFMRQHCYAFSYTCYSEMDSDGQPTGVLVSGPSRITKAGMYAFCWPGCLTVMYDTQIVGLIQIEDIKKNNDYAMWLKVSRKADCYLLPENLATYRKGRAGSVSNHSIVTMIKWHYILFRETERMAILPSLWHTCVNLVCGTYKKIVYIHRKGVQT